MRTIRFDISILFSHTHWHSFVGTWFGCAFAVRSLYRRRCMAWPSAASQPCSAFIQNFISHQWHSIHSIIDCTCVVNNAHGSWRAHTHTLAAEIAFSKANSLKWMCVWHIAIKSNKRFEMGFFLSVYFSVVSIFCAKRRRYLIGTKNVQLYVCYIVWVCLQNVPIRFFNRIAVVVGVVVSHSRCG